MRFRRPGRRLVSSISQFGAVLGLMLETPWNMSLDSPPNIRTSPDSRTTFESISSSLTSPYKNSVVSPIEKETTGNPFSMLLLDSSLSYQITQWYNPVSNDQSRLQHYDISIVRSKELRKLYYKPPRTRNSGE